MSSIERVENPIPMAELERRWAAVRREMKARNIDALVTQNSSDWLGGYVKWFTDVPAHNDYPRTVIFHRDDLMTAVEMGNKDRRTALGGQDPLNPGVGDWVFSPSFFSVCYTHDYDGALVAQELKHRGYKTVGWVGKGRLQHDLVRVVETQASAIAFVDATDWIDGIKAIKSEAEIALIRRAAAMQDAIWAAILPKIRPGMRDFELTALAQYEGELRGSQQGLFRCSSAPLGEPAVLRGRHYQGRSMRAGDYMTLLIENNGPGGHYAELARTFVLGKASQELRDDFAVVVAAQQHTVKNLKIGAPPAAIYESHNAFMTRHGAPPEMRLYGHSQGYDLVERPLLRADETMPLAANMNMAVHPGFFKPTNFVFICDNFLIKEDGSVEHLHQTEQKIWEL
ncbi:MAG: aminopeptidase P family protein [Hyphomicrobiales bacterium]|nr:aminopeptidase P family protein [Hyphomicrobiales bacterium]